MRQASPAEIQDAMRSDVGPQMGDPIAELYMQQLADPSVNTPPKPFSAATIDDVNPEGKFVFMSKLGYRGVVLNLPIPEHTDDEKWEERQVKIYARKYRGREDELAHNIELAERMGETLIAFKPLPGKFQCAYDTDDEQIAEYIRNSPEFKEGRVYEVTPPITMMVNGKPVKVVPADSAERVALSEALRG